MSPPDWAVQSGFQPQTNPFAEAEETLEEATEQDPWIQDPFAPEAEAVDEPPDLPELGPEDTGPLDWADRSKPLMEDVPGRKELRSTRLFRTLEEDEFNAAVKQSTARARDEELDWFSETGLGGRGQRTLEKLPFSGVITANRLMETALAAHEWQTEGVRTEEGARLIGEYFAELDRQKGLTTFDKVIELAADMPGFFVEIGLTSGGYTVVSRGTQKVLLRTLRKMGAKYLKEGVSKVGGRSLATKLAIKGAGFAAGSGALTALNPQLIAEQTSERALHHALQGDEDAFVKAMWQGPLGAYFELGSEMSGGMGAKYVTGYIAKKAGIKKMMEAAASKWLIANPRSRLAHFMALKNKVGWHGIFEEIEEERLVDIARGLSKIDDDFGTTGRLFSEDPEERSKAWEQIKVEFYAFSLVGGGMKAPGLFRSFKKAPIEKMEDFAKNPSRKAWKKIEGSYRDVTEEEDGTPMATSPLPIIGRTYNLPTKDKKTGEVDTENLTPQELNPNEEHHRQWLGENYIGPFAEAQLEGLRQRHKEYFGIEEPTEEPVEGPAVVEDEGALEGVEDVEETEPVAEEPTTPAEEPAREWQVGDTVQSGRKKGVKTGKVVRVLPNGNLEVQRPGEAKTTVIDGENKTLELVSPAEAAAAPEAEVAPAAEEPAEAPVVEDLLQPVLEAIDRAIDDVPSEEAEGYDVEAAKAGLKGIAEKVHEEGDFDNPEDFWRAVKEAWKEAHPHAESARDFLRDLGLPVPGDAAAAAEPAPAAEAPMAATYVVNGDPETTAQDAIDSAYENWVQTFEEADDFTDDFDFGLVQRTGFDVTASETGNSRTQGKADQAASDAFWEEVKNLMADGSQNFSAEQFLQSKHRTKRIRTRSEELFNQLFPAKGRISEVPGIKKKDIPTKRKKRGKPKIEEMTWEERRAFWRTLWQDATETLIRYTSPQGETEPFTEDPEQFVLMFHTVRETLPDMPRVFDHEDRVSGISIQGSDPEIKVYQHAMDSVLEFIEEEWEALRSILPEALTDLDSDYRDAKGRSKGSANTRRQEAYAKESLKAQEARQALEALGHSREDAAARVSEALKQKAWPLDVVSSLSVDALVRAAVNVELPMDIKGDAILALRQQGLSEDAATKKVDELLAKKDYTDAGELVKDALRRDKPAPKQYTKREMVSGKKVKILTADGEKIDGRYALVELDDLTASHRATEIGAPFTPEGNYPRSLQPRNYDSPEERNKVDDYASNPEAGFLINDNPDATSGPPSVTPEGIVINGNGRTLVLQLSHGDWYTDALREEADHYGLSEESVDKFEMPVLVRVVDMDPAGPEAKDFAEVGNVAMTQAQTPQRMAQSMSKLVGFDMVQKLDFASGKTIAALLDGPGGRKFLDDVYHALLPQVRAQFMDSDLVLTDAGKELIRDMFLAAAFDIEVIEKLTSNAKYLKGLFVNSLPTVLAIKASYPDADISSALAEAAIFISGHRQLKTTEHVSEFLASGTLFETDPKDTISPQGRMMLDLLLEIGDKPNVFRSALKSLHAELGNEREGLFIDRANLKSVPRVISETLGAFAKNRGESWEVPEREGATFESADYKPARRETEPSETRDPDASPVQVPDPNTDALREAEEKDESLVGRLAEHIRTYLFDNPDLQGAIKDKFGLTDWDLEIEISEIDDAATLIKIAQEIVVQGPAKARAFFEEVLPEGDMPEKGETAEDLDSQSFTEEELERQKEELIVQMLGIYDRIDHITRQLETAEGGEEAALRLRRARMKVWKRVLESRWWDIAHQQYKTGQDFLRPEHEVASRWNEPGYKSSVDVTLLGEEEISLLELSDHEIWHMTKVAAGIGDGEMLTVLLGLDKFGVQDVDIVPVDDDSNTHLIDTFVVELPENRQQQSGIWDAIEQDGVFFVFEETERQTMEEAEFLYFADTVDLSSLGFITTSKPYELETTREDLVVQLIDPINRQLAEDAALDQAPEAASPLLTDTAVLEEAVELVGDHHGARHVRVLANTKKYTDPKKLAKDAVNLAEAIGMIRDAERRVRPRLGGLVELTESQLRLVANVEEPDLPGIYEQTPEWYEERGYTVEQLPKIDREGPYHLTLPSDFNPRAIADFLSALGAAARQKNQSQRAAQGVKNKIKKEYVESEQGKRAKELNIDLWDMITKAELEPPVFAPVEGAIEGEVSGIDESPARPVAPLPSGAVPAHFGFWTYEDPRGSSGRPVAMWQIIRRLSLLPRLFGYEGVTELPIQTGGLRSPTAVGEAHHQELMVKIRDADDMLTAFHEIGHIIEVLIFGHGLVKDPVTGKIKRTTPWKTSAVGKAVVDELTKLGVDLWGTKKPKGGLAREGFAEFIRLYLENRSEAQSKAPKTLRWFERTVTGRAKGKKALRAMDRIAKMVTSAREQGLLNWARDIVVDPASLEERFEEFKDMMRLSPNALIRNMVEALQPLELLEQQYEKTTGKPIADVDSAYKWGQALRLQHSAVVHHMVNDGMINFSRDEVKGGVTLSQLEKFVKAKDYKDFTVYLVARRSLKLIKNEKITWDEKGKVINREPAPLDTPMTEEQATKIIDMLNKKYPKFGAGADIFYKWNDGVLQYVAEADEFLGQVVGRIRRKEKERGDYAPLRRYMRATNLALARYGGPRVGFMDVFNALKGSKRMYVVDPIQTAISNAERLVLAAHNRKVVSTMISMAGGFSGTAGEPLGFGNLIFQEVRDRELKHAATVESTAKQVFAELKRIGYSPDVVDHRGIPVGIDDVQWDEHSLIEFYGMAMTPKSGEPIIPVKDAKGAIRWYRMEPSVYQAVQSMSKDGLEFLRKNNWARWAINVGGLMPRQTARLFRAGTVGFRASFGLVTNPLRDFQTLYLNTSTSANGLTLFSNFMLSFGEEFLSAITAGRYRSKYSKLWLRLGGRMSLPLSQDTNLVAQAARDVVESKNIGRRIIRYVTDPKRIPQHAWNDWNTFLSFWKDFLQFPESATRMAEIRTVAKEIGWSPTMPDGKGGTQARPMSAEQAQKLILAGKQVTVDFTAAGDVARAWNQYIPFFNAAIQGPRAAIRAARRPVRMGKLAGVPTGPVHFATRGMQLTALAIANWFRNKDEDWYIRLNAREKFLYMFYPTEVFGESSVVMIPMAHDSGQLFSGLAVAFLDAWYRREPDEVLKWAELRDYADTMFESHMPIDIPWDFKKMRPAPTNLLGKSWQTMMELMANQKSYFETPVVSSTFMGPGGRDRIPKQQQFNEYTTEAAKWLGNLSGMTPVEIDHAIVSVAGPAARDYLLAGQSLDGLFTGKKLQSLSDVPILGRVFRKGGEAGTRTRPINEVYDLYEYAYTRHGDRNRQETPDENKEFMLLQDATKAISLMFHIRTVTDNEKDRRAMTNKASEMAESAINDINEMRLVRDPYRLEAARLEQERDEMRMFKAYEDGDMELAESLREELHKSKQSALRRVMQGFPTLKNPTPDALEKAMWQQKRAGAIAFPRR